MVLTTAEVKRTVDTRATSGSDADLLRRLEERGNGGAVLTPKNSRAQALTPKGVAGETDRHPLASPTSSDTDATSVGRPTAMDTVSLSPKGVDFSNHWVAPMETVSSAQKGQGQGQGQTLETSASAPAISSMLQEERATRVAAQRGRGQDAAVTHCVPGMQRAEKGDTAASRLPGGSDCPPGAQADERLGIQTSKAKADDWASKEDQAISLPMLNVNRCAQCSILSYHP